AACQSPDMRYAVRRSGSRRTPMNSRKLSSSIRPASPLEPSPYECGAGGPRLHGETRFRKTARAAPIGLPGYVLDAGLIAAAGGLRLAGHANAVGAVAWLTGTVCVTHSASFSRCSLGEVTGDDHAVGQWLQRECPADGPGQALGRPRRQRSD